MKAKADDKAILVWRFNEAPQWLQDLSEHGGDEDWLAVVPLHLKDEYIPWLEVGRFGPCEVSSHELESGLVVKIGAHA